jgi:hypothetical protein
VSNRLLSYVRWNIRQDGAPIAPSVLPGSALRRRNADRGFECVAAGIAFPQMPDAPCVDEFGPFRREQVLAALRAFDNRARTRG